MAKTTLVSWVLIAVTLGVVLGMWLSQDRRPEVLPQVIALTHRYNDLRMTCLEFTWYTVNNRLIAPPQIVCQSDLVLIQTLIAAYMLQQQLPITEPKNNRERTN